MITLRGVILLCTVLLASYVEHAASAGYCVSSGNRIPDGQYYNATSTTGWVFNCKCVVNGPDPCTLLSCKDRYGVSHPAGQRWTTVKPNHNETCICPVEKASDGKFYRYCNVTYRSVAYCVVGSQRYENGEKYQYTSSSGWVFECVCDTSGPDKCHLVKCKYSGVSYLADRFWDLILGGQTTAYDCICPKDLISNWAFIFCVYRNSAGKCWTGSGWVNSGAWFTRAVSNSAGTVTGTYKCKCGVNDSCKLIS